jgi:uncharacterized protein involved in response to NO
MTSPGARSLPPLRAPAQRPVSGRPPEPSTPSPWRLSHLLLAPHRLGFFLALGLLLASGLWWALVQLDRATGWFGLGYTVSPTLTHAALMSLGFIPLFFAGFLFTAGPKWLGVPGPEARDLVPSAVLQAVGWLLWLTGAHTHAGVALAGISLAAVGLAMQAWRFWGLVRASRQVDRLHAQVVAMASGVGVLSVTGIAAATAFDAVDLGRAFVLSGLWGFVVPTYLAVAHRMIPFFTSSAVPMVHAWRPFWVLWAMLGAAALEWVSVWIHALWGAVPPSWMLLQGVAELAAGGVLIWLGVAWGLVQSLKVRLLAMLHLGFVWLGLSFVLAGASQLLGLQAGVPALGLGALHALTMGCLGSLLLAMVTRVACGHSGRPLVADNLIWVLFWTLQVAVLLRIAGALPHAPAGVLVAAAWLWAGVVVVWGLRLMGWFGRLRADGRPG